MKKLNKVFLIISLIVIASILTFGTMFSSLSFENAAAREIEVDEWNVYDSLDYGLYFYGPDSDQPIKAGTERTSPSFRRSFE